jgi:hypothetical protein
MLPIDSPRHVMLIDPLSEGKRVRKYFNYNSLYLRSREGLGDEPTTPLPNTYAQSL